MKSCCMDHNCIRCCLDTNMILSNDDINRLKELGFDPNFFVNRKNGWLELKNKNGRCVFHDGTSCLIYKYRPEGCRLYPIIFDKDKKSAVLDKDCPHRNEFKISKNAQQQIYRLVSKLELEKALRKNALGYFWDS